MAENESASSETEISTDDELEPKFKYLRIAHDLKDIVKSDVITACAVYSKFLILGTYMGRVHLLDHQGNTVQSHLNYIFEQFAHSISINEVDIDVKGEYIATCSHDGVVHIIGLVNDKYNHTEILDQPVYAVALDPDTRITDVRRFIVGDNKLVLFERNFLKKLKPHVLSNAEGHVVALSWNGSLVAWASCVGVRVYDLNDKCSLGLMQWEKPINGCLDNFRCNFYWSNANTLLIGWVDTIRVCIIRKRNHGEVALHALPVYIVDPISTFRTSFYVSGLASLTSNQLVVLGYPKEKDRKNKSLRPVLSVIEYTLNGNEEICTDSLSIIGYEEYSVNDYILKCLNEENRYYIVAPKDVVVAILFDVEDRLQWLIEHNKFEEALEITSLHDGNVVAIARMYIDHLLMNKEFDAAAKVCLKVLGNNRDLWEEEVIKFIKLEQIRSVSGYLPTAEDCKLNPHIYEIALFEYLRYDVNGFLKLIKEWPPNLYDCLAVISAVRLNFSKDHHKKLLESLALLYSYVKDYENALSMYLMLEHKAVFDLIRCHDLYKVIHKMIVPLIQLDRERAFQILLDKRKISSEIVIKELEHKEEYLYSYLDALEKVDRGGTFHLKLIELHAKYNPAKLLPFLKRSKHYPIQDALDICKSKLLYVEMAYLLSQMGNVIEALNIIIHKIRDFEMAINFCKKHDDSDLWNLLIDKSVGNPTIITKLFDGIIGYVNPDALINKIKSNQEIPELRQSLFKMLWDYRLQVNIQQCCNALQLNDYFNNHAKTVRQQQRGFCINFDDLCAYCQRNIITKNVMPLHDVIVFNCGHMYHKPCILQVNFKNLNSQESCSLCIDKYYDDKDMY